MGLTSTAASVSDTDFVVVGAGIAGLRAAITLAAHGRVLVITKEQLGESNTSYAQGGIAVAISGDEDVALHLEDTIAAGDGLVNAEAARVLVQEGPLRVEELLRWGTGFDRHVSGDRAGDLMLTREGAHSRNRILHANGDATGAEIGRALLAHARSHPAITFVEWATCVDLVTADGRVSGLTYSDRAGQLYAVRARAVLLASGGAGQVYSDTTNPAVATGDGIAMAWRAGAALADMEFYQFHPTALSLPGVARFLLSEALRGEGAVLVNDRGERFMERYHPLLELAPRDVVARAITREGLGPDGSARPVYLDMRQVSGIDLVQRFPGISAFLARHGLALSRDLIPVRPAAHYLMGGVRTDVHGRTSLARLFAAGEVACTGVHGANRLASNSLLEGLVFGARAAEAMVSEPVVNVFAPLTARVAEAQSVDSSALRHKLRALMWLHAGLLRDGAGLQTAADQLTAIEPKLPTGTCREAVELRNLHAIASLIVRSALAREESRGAHYRNDFSMRDDLRFRKHSVVAGGNAVVFCAD
jgi:L-aspartate oxidase